MREEDVRERLVQALEADLVGPFLPPGHPEAGEERLELPPSRWYLTGFLAPKGGEDPDEDDDESVDEGLGAGSDSQSEDAGQEEASEKRRLHFPASMGLSFYLPPGSGDALSVEVSFADYSPVEEALERTDRVTTLWKRLPYGPRRVRVPLDAALLASREGVRVPETTGIVLRGELRTTDAPGLPAGTRVVSLFIVNERTPQEQHADQQFIFQVKLRIGFDGGFRARRNPRGDDGDDYDQRVLALLFRDSLEWAVGHNTSVRNPAVVEGKVVMLETTQLPTYEVRRVAHRTLADAEMGMAALAKLDGEGLRNALMPIVDAYSGWIDGQQRVPLDGEALGQTREGLVGLARQARDRIREGIDLVATDPQARRAFCLANQAMHVAAMRSDEGRTDKRYKDGHQPSWRPFQLAFVLLNLAPVADPQHRDRKVAELIYFPTGGGKTEAYLGLIAYTLLLRRIRGRGTDHEGRGVAVVLRYTLRLLTLDQLGRAATLICALEALRARNPRELGDSRFTIGLWVGSAATPNKLKSLSDALDDRRRGDGESPFPLPACPWCSKPIRVENIKMVDDRGAVSKTGFTRVAVCCDGDCLFTERATNGLGLPVSFVDEQIYRDAPAFVVATVDKYAMVPWLTDAGAMFGRVTHADASRVYTARDHVPADARPLPHGLLPPELIVQDELHLISGPLGTMVGLFEAAVDYLCSRESHGQERPPKIVCSTATVRRAREQIQALFGRDKMALFPPRGVSDTDNFFSEVLTDKPGRLYVGVGAPGRALRAVTVRTYATLLAAAQRSFDPKGEPAQPADPYMTLVGYFNSLRELGGMRRLVDDEVTTRVRKMADERRPPHFLDPHPWASNREVRFPEELTSRVSTDTVKRTKDRLATRRVEKSGSGGAEPLDVVLASNMISVGLDIDRLGLMVVTGQPKTTSEYIQATSRVGRAYPGLVITCLNTARPRDRSHYERFVAYHASFYRDVEATSVTPFSGQALDRGLNAAILAMVRHAIESMRMPLGFMQIHANRDAANRIVHWLVTRAKGHRRMPDADAEERIAAVIASRGQSFLDAWERVVFGAREGSAKRIYWEHDHSPGDALDVLFVATDAGQRTRDRYERQFQFPTSMRDVEPNAHLWVSLSQLDKRS
jgi:hypothetical protein